MQGLEAKQRQFKEYLGGSSWQEEGARIIQASQKITTWGGRHNKSTMLNVFVPIVMSRAATVKTNSARQSLDTGR